MTATIHAFPGPGPVFGGEDFHDNARRLANAVYDGEKDAFWIAVATLMTSADEGDRRKGWAAYDARLLAQYMAEPEPEAPHAPGLIPGWLMAAGTVCCIGSVMIAGYVLEPLARVL